MRTGFSSSWVGFCLNVAGVILRRRGRQIKPETQRADQIFSIQVFASKSNAEVKEFKRSIESLFEEEIRIDYQAPYYRVCIGKVAGYENGEALLNRVISMGFSKAWLVKIRK